MQPQRNSLCNRFRTWLAQAGVWIGLCGLGFGSVPLAGAQGLDNMTNITPPAFSHGANEQRIAHAVRALETTASSTQDSLGAVQELIEILNNSKCRDLLPDFLAKDYTEKSVSLALNYLANLAGPEFNGVFLELANAEKILTKIELSKMGQFAQEFGTFLSMNALRKDMCEYYEIHFRDTDGAGEEFIRFLDGLATTAHIVRDILSVVPGMTRLTVASEVAEDVLVKLTNETINATIDLATNYNDGWLTPYYIAARAGQEYNYSQRGILSEMLWAYKSDEEIEEKINEFVAGNKEYLRILPELRQEVEDMRWYTGGPLWGKDKLLKIMDDTLDWIEKYGTEAKLKEFVAMQKPRLQEMKQQQLDAAAKELDDILQKLDSAPDEKEGVGSGGESSAGEYTLTLIKKEGIGRVSVIEIKSDLTENIQECDSDKDSCTFRFNVGANVVLMPLFENDDSRKLDCKDEHNSKINLLPIRYNYCHLSMNKNYTLTLSLSGNKFFSKTDFAMKVDPLLLPEEWSRNRANGSAGGAIIFKHGTYQYNPGFGFSFPISVIKNLGDVTFEAVPNKGWSFVKWYGNCSGNSIICTLPMNSDNSRVTALFVKTDQIIEIGDRNTKKTEPTNPTLGIQIIGKGHVFFDPYATDGIGNPVSGVYKIQTEGQKSDAPWSFYFDKNSTITLTARAEASWKFTGWDGACAHANSQNACTVTMDKAQSVSALFSPDDGAAEPPIKNPPQDKEPIDIELGNGCQARDFSAMEERVQDAYIALYGRPADVDGLAYWSKELTAAGGDIHAILDDFIDPTTEEYRRRFSDKDDAELLDILYKHLFGPSREIDPDGFLAYLGDMLLGTFKLTSTAIKVVDGVPQDSSDWVELEARRKLARHYVTIMEAIPGGDTNVILADYQAMLRGMENVNSVCNALSEAVFPASR